MTDNSAQMAGELLTDVGLRPLSSRLASAGLRVQIRESSHYQGGEYIRVYEGADFTMEHVGLGEYLARGDAGSVEQMLATASRVSQALTGLGIRHRFEVYDSGNRLAGYLHHDWPQTDEG